MCNPHEPIKWLHCSIHDITMLQQSHLWWHNGTNWGTLNKLKAAQLLSPSSNNQHDKIGFCENVTPADQTTHIRHGWIQYMWWNWEHIDGLAQDCSNSIATALELLQSCSKPSICCCGIWQWINLGWCYLFALEAVPLMKLSASSLDRFIVKYQNAICSCYTPAQCGHIPWCIWSWNEQTYTGFICI